MSGQEVREELVDVLGDHRPLTRSQLPPLLVSGCTCGWGSEVFSHTAHLAQELAAHTAPLRAEVERQGAVLAAVEALRDEWAQIPVIAYTGRAQAYDDGLRQASAALTAALASAPEGDQSWCYCPSVESDDLTTLVCSKCGNRIKPVGGGV